MQSRKDEPQVIVGNVGKPPATLSATEAAIWHEFSASAPWLSDADRGTLETYARLKNMERTDFVGMMAAEKALMTRIGGLLGLNPSERSRIKAEKPKEENPDDAFFRAANAS